MKFRSKRLAWLVAAPAAWISGCGLGPFSGLHRESAVISLRQPDPLAAMQRSTSIVGVSPEEGAFSTADLQGLNPDDPEGFRLLQLTAARRRANQQMMMQMMMQPMLVPQVQQQPQHRPSTPSSGSSSSSTAQKRPTSPTTSGPSASTAGKSGGSSSSSTTARTTPPRPTTPPPAAMPVNPLLMNPYLMAEMPPLAGGRRPNRAEIRENRAHRTENATTVEANRIERAAAAEAERAEKAALAEAQLAERRLLAEAEIVERMTRAETELAERLAAAKDERDRRIEIARQERELRFAILGLDANELDHDPAAEALARFNKTKPATNDEVSAFTRFTRFLRTRTDEQDRSGGDRSPSHEANRKGPPADDLPDRLRDSADALQDPRTLAQAASRLPSGEPERAPREEVWPEATSTAQNSASRAPVENLHPSLLGNSRTPVHEEIFNRATAEPQQPVASAAEGRRWSPLDDLIQPASASGTSPSGGDRVAGGSPPAFPESFAAPAERMPSAVDRLLSNQSAGTRDAAELTPPTPPTAAQSDAASTASNTSGRKLPENDLWILGGRGPNEPAPGGAGGPAAEFPASASIAEQDPSRYTQPGGLYGEVRTPSTPPVAQRSIASAAPDAPSRHSLLDDVWATTPQFASGNGAVVDEPVDPAFVAQSAAPSTALEPASDPWLLSEAAPPAVADVNQAHAPAASGFPSRHEPANAGFMLPTLPQPVQQTAWTQKSLIDVCGPLPGDLEALVTQLDIPEAGVRKEVLHDLGQLGNRARPALPAIRVLLEDHPLIAAHAAWTIWNITQDEKEVTRELMRLLQSGQPEVVQFSAYALGSLGAKALSAAPALQIERERFNGATRLHVAEALTRIDAFDEASVQVLTSSLTSSEPHLRWLAALSLGHVQTRHAATVVPALAGALLDPDPEVRSAAALSLGGFGSAAMIAVPELQRRATLDAPNVREAAQTALACIRK